MKRFLTLVFLFPRWHISTIATALIMESFFTQTDDSLCSRRAQLQIHVDVCNFASVSTFLRFDRQL